MTSAEAPKRLYIPQPFASAEGAALTEIEIATSNNVNFADGFPSVYEAPSSNNGKFVTRGEMNAIGNLASANEFARACGGIVTFDQRLATKIGGYPRGAVLEMLSGLDYARVVSLVDDNLVDFTGNSIDTTIVGNKCKLGSVDGVNWAFCERGSVPDYQTVLEIPNIKFFGNEYSSWEEYVGVFTAPSDGSIVVLGNADITAHSVEANSSGIIIVAAPFTGDTPPANPISTQYNHVYARGELQIETKDKLIKYNSASVAPCSVTKGVKYAVFVLMHLASIENSTLKLAIR